MIAKNIKGKGFAGCVRYVLNDSHELLEAEGVLADSAESIVRSFAMQRSMRAEIAKPVGHIPISFAPEDSPRMTNEFMLQLAKEYMQEMGIGRTQYVVVRHHNTDNDHLHIVYNRIDNDLKLISVNNDFKRNVEVCKKLKDKHNLTYGKGKERVKREKLNHPDKAKYKIYDSITKVLPHCKNENELRSTLKLFAVETEFKLSRTTGEVQGVSFRHGKISFKGSDIDRKYSFANLKKEFSKNLDLYNQKLKEFDIRQFIPDDLPKNVSSDESRIVQPSVKDVPKQPVSGATTTQEPSAKTPPIKRKHVINGVELTNEQTQILLDGGHIFLENMTLKDGIRKISTFVFLCDQKEKIFYTYDDPDKFVKYGKWEMRIRDKQQIEAGYITRAKIKYWGGTFARPYLWKPGAVKDEAARQLTGYKLEEDSDYCQSWSDPRKVEQVQNPAVNIIGSARAVGLAGVDTLANATSTASGLLDITPNNPVDDHNQEQQHRKLKKQIKKWGKKM